MGAERQTKIASSLPIFAVLAMIGGAYYVSQSPLKSSRPEAPAGLREPVLEMDKIEARLWQDPLKAALDHEEAMQHDEGKTQDKSGGRQCASTHCVNQISEHINYLISRTEQSREEKKDKDNTNVPIVHVLLTIGRDGTFAEDQERRLRNRYAMLTALGASGFAPEDSKHIQYFKLPWLDKKELEEMPDDEVPKIDDVNSRPRPLVVPFEWCNRTELYPPERKNECPEHALVIWLGESSFSDRPLTRLAQVIDAIRHKDNPKVKIDVIGPSRSTTLRAMLKEVDKCKDYKPGRCGFVDVKSMLDGLTIFSPWSTASPVLLMDDDANCPSKSNETANCENSVFGIFEKIREKFDEIDVRYVRMIGSDDLLAMELINELLRRGVNVVPEPNGAGDHVALICEWDTFYGKAFPLTFATMMENMEPGGEPKDWNKYAVDLNKKKPNLGGYLPENLHTYSYIRGIDGRLPESESAEEKEPKNQTGSESKWAYAKSLELPIGRGQLDYVRRLAQKLRDENKYGGRKKKLKAIGVVGTDVYDKMILLHALRERFSNIILFTIDIDARMMHYEQSKWTRNVVVASNYGLELNRHYQRSIYQTDKGRLPPFRDNYQTALFLACRAALGLPTHENNIPFRKLCGEHLAAMVSRPRVFEIGRGRAVNLTVSRKNPKDIAEIHPPHSRWPGWGTFLEYAVPVVVAIGAFIALLVLVNECARRNARAIWRMMKKAKAEELKPAGKRAEEKNTGEVKSQKKETEEKKKEEGETKGIIAGVSAVAVVLFVAVVIIDHYRPGGEPFSLFSGVSIWPGQALRLLVAILSVYFISKSLKDLRENEKDLTKWFRPKKQKELGKADAPATPDKEGPKKETLFKRLLHALDPHTWWACVQKRRTIYDWAVKDEDSVDAKDHWAEYLKRASLGNRFFRVIRMVLVYVLLALMLMLLLGFPNTPYRGKVSLCVNYILLILSVLLMMVLIFLVVDATRLSLKFIRGLKGPTTNWPDERTDPFKPNAEDQDEDSDSGSAQLPEDSGTKSNKTLEGLDEWLDIKFIAAHTEAVGKLIYYPFIILLIMFVARTPYFDNWDFPISLIIIFLLNSTYALVCAMRLRREAEKTRELAIKRLKKELVKAAAGRSTRSTEQIKAMIEDVRSIQQGAYSPFSENPVVHAILIPSGGMSLLTLLRFLPLS